MVATGYGLGKKMANMNMANVPTLVKVYFLSKPPVTTSLTNTSTKILIASNTFYFLCNWAIKHALLLFYTGLATRTTHFRLIYVMHFIAFGFGLSSILVDIFQCWPMKKTWDRSVDGWCVDITSFYYANAIIMLATDCVLYAMPLIFTRSLRLRRKQTWGLRCLFGLGVL
jgi:hypothetical protein